MFEPYAKLEDSLTYDVTAWALPYAYGLQAYALPGKIKQTQAQPQVLSRTVTKPTIAQPYAYLARWNSLSDLQFLSALLRQSIKIRYSEKAFETDSETYAPGTLIITRAGNEALGEAFDKIIKAEAEKAGVQVTPTPTGFVSTGADFGSGSVRYLRKPKVAVISGQGVSEAGFGEVWHFFEQQIKFPVTVLDAQYFSRVPLSNFDVLILPGGNYTDILTEKVMSQVREWVTAGGKLISLENATNFLAGKRGFALTKKNHSDSSDVSKNPYALLKPYGNSERNAIADAVLGSVYRVSLDNTHPLAFGYGDTYFALIQEVNNFGFMKEGWNVGVLKKDIYTSGFVGSRARKKLQDTLVLGHQSVGRGQVVYMADNPLFRAFWHNSKLLFGNAVFLVGN